MTKPIDKFTVSGKLVKWDINKFEFTLDTPVGDIKINIKECSSLMLNEMVDTMRLRRTVTIKMVEE